MACGWNGGGKPSQEPERNRRRPVRCWRSTHGFAYDENGFLTIDRPNSSMTVARGINPRGTSSACSAMLLVRTDCPQARVIELAFRGTDGQVWPSVTRDAELTATGNTTLSDPLIGATLVA